MTKRALSPSSSPVSINKRPHFTSFRPNKIATRQNAAAVDADPPFNKLLSVLKGIVKDARKGDSVVYWMRMGDIRVSDNRALSLASEYAQMNHLPLIVVFILSPQDYLAHDRSSRRIDFTLRNLHDVQSSLSSLNIPLKVIQVDNRRAIPSRLISFLSALNCNHLFANIEYEVDELRRDIRVCDLAKDRSLHVTFAHDRCIVEPGVVATKEGNAYSVYTPYQKRWLKILNENLPYYLEDCPTPHSNDVSVKTSTRFAELFDSQVPEFLEDFRLAPDDREIMKTVFPAGERAAKTILQHFLESESRGSQLGSVNPLEGGSKSSNKSSRVNKYDQERDLADKDTTSRLSPYLSAGIISVRACVRATMALQGVDKVDGGKSSGIGRWVQELAWRDFYSNILVAFPRVSMGRPYLEKFADVAWEQPDGTELTRWKEGKTGYPIVDAAMRCLNEMGWIHNRLRMICAMFLTKDLMIDWRVGEKYFMENLIDGDLASNNGGWQWSASTGVDPCPYFRIFNPYSQSTKVDPSGDFIRHYVPELRKLKGKDIHNPSSETARALGYPMPIVKHDGARARALTRFKNPGSK